MYNDFKTEISCQAKNHGMKKVIILCKLIGVGVGLLTTPKNKTKSAKISSQSYKTFFFAHKEFFRFLLLS